MSVSTLNEIFYTVAESHRERVMMHRRALDWVAISSQELYRDVAGVALALLSWGLEKGDRIAILAENRAEWAIADFACQLIGAVTVPIYSTLTGQQTAFILNDSRCRAIFLSTEQQLQKVQGIKEQTAIQRVIVMDPVETTHAVHMESLMLAGPLNPDANLDARARQAAASDLATVIYTSG